MKLERARFRHEKAVVSGNVSILNRQKERPSLIDTEQLESTDTFETVRRVLRTSVVTRVHYGRRKPHTRTTTRKREEEKEL